MQLFYSLVDEVNGKRRLKGYIGKCGVGTQHLTHGSMSRRVYNHNPKSIMFMISWDKMYVGVQVFHVLTIV